MRGRDKSGMVQSLDCLMSRSKAWIFYYLVLDQTSLRNRFSVIADGRAAQHILEECMSSPRSTARPVTTRGQPKMQRETSEDLRRQYAAEEAVMNPEDNT